MRKTLIALLGLLVMIFIVYGTVITYDVLSRFSFSELDFNENGTTSLSELFTAGDLGKRPVDVNNKGCIDYFYLKDGTSFKIKCE